MEQLGTNSFVLYALKKIHYIIYLVLVILSVISTTNHVGKYGNM